MKAFTTVLALTAAAMFSMPALAQTPDQYLLFSVFYNSNVTAQQTVYQELQFSDYGTDSLDSYDFGDTTVIPASTSLAWPFSVTSNGDVVTQNDSRPQLTVSGYKTVDFGFYSMSPATISLYPTLLMGMMSSSQNSTPVGPRYLYLEDLSSGQIYSFLDTITINIPAHTTFTPNFRLHFGPAVVIDSVANETCYNTNDGHLRVTNPNTTNWTLTVYKNGTPLFTSPVAGTDTMLTGLGTGTYTTVTHVGNMLADSSETVISGPAQVIASFTPDTYLTYESTAVNFTNASTGATSYAWDFGDSNTDSVVDPSHAFTVAGSYVVTLTASNSNGCQSVSTVTINVLSAPMAYYNGPGRGNPSNNSTLRNGNSFEVTAANGSGKITIAQIGETKEASVQLYTIGGQLVSTTQMNEQTTQLAVPQSGFYLVMIQSNGETTSKKIFVN